MIVYVHRVDLSKSIKEISQIRNLFALSMKKETKRLVFSEDKLRSIYSELLINYILVVRYGINVNEVQIKKNSNGKKFIIGHPFIKFNISHSGHWVVIALSNEDIGIDIQKVESICIDSINNYLGEQEYYKSIKTHRKENFFYQNWVIRESFLKALGRGFTIPFSLNDIKINRESQQVSNIEDIYHYSLMDFEKDYMLCVCQKAPITKIKIIKVSEGELKGIITSRLL